MRGTYVLLIEVKKSKVIKIGALDKINFQKGFYAYVGSALNNLEKRIKRHLSQKKKTFWHIDYLLKKAKIKEVYHKESNWKEECQIAGNLAKKFPSIKNFGCSDCRCPSHLFFAENFENLEKETLKSF